MCIRRKIEEAQPGSTVDHKGRKWVILNADLETAIEKAGLQLSEGSNMLSLPFGTEVTAHYMTSAERNLHGPARCELPLIEVENDYSCQVRGCLEPTPHAHQGSHIVPIVLARS